MCVHVLAHVCTCIDNKMNTWRQHRQCAQGNAATKCTQVTQARRQRVEKGVHVTSAHNTCVGGMQGRVAGVSTRANKNLRKILPTQISSNCWETDIHASTKNEALKIMHLLLVPYVNKQLIKRLLAIIYIITQDRVGPVHVLAYVYTC